MVFISTYVAKGIANFEFCKFYVFTVYKFTDFVLKRTKSVNLPCKFPDDSYKKPNKVARNKDLL